MTNVLPNHLSKFMRDQSNRNKMEVLDAIRKLGKTEPRRIDIYRYLINKSLEEVEQNYQNKGNVVNGEINSKLQKIARENTMDIRTIDRKLRSLERDGLIKHRGQRYVLTDLALNELKYFTKDYALEYGIISLFALMQHHSATRSLKANLDHLIKIFGIYVVYFLIEACRPLGYDKKLVDHKLPNKSKDKLIETWLRSGLDPVVMLQFFLVGIKSSTHSKVRRSASIDWMREFDKLDAIEEYYKDNDQKEPLYELGNSTIKAMTNVIYRNYPVYFNRLLEARLVFLGKPKEGSLKNIRNTIREYDAKEDPTYPDE
jgi:hypothetical protein